MLPWNYLCKSIMKGYRNINELRRYGMPWRTFRGLSKLYWKSFVAIGVFSKLGILRKALSVFSMSVLKLPTCLFLHTTGF